MPGEDARQVAAASIPGYALSSRSLHELPDSVVARGGFIVKLGLFVFLSAACLLAAPAQAQNWVRYAETKDRTFSYAPDTIERDGNVVRVWDRMQMAPTRSAFGDMQTEARGQWEFNCPEGSYHIIGFASYYEGKLLHSGSAPRGAPSYPAPGGAGERLMKLVCTR
jgi:hypothetical protein